MPNRLIKETSPYLLQHANNPVDWYPWGEEALQKAKNENKPILVSIGYAACHWCHVMEKESFENHQTADLMNENFVNIKIDREERPDLDHIYMDAVQAMTGSGGWPLNVFLTPDAKPFYGGTYFPPARAFNRPSWTELLQAVISSFKEKRNEIDAQAENMTEHLLQSNSFGLQEGDQGFLKENIDEAFRNCMKQADRQWGGFGKAPKFPQTFTIQFLLRYYNLTKNEDALEQACLSLDKMIDGGIYDHAGGGFARYSTDETWLVPHFEKMLYDNALFVSVLSEAYQLTKRKKYAEVIAGTIEFIEREMMHSGGGFYSALDADSEGEEGKFYVWKVEEVKKILKEDAEIFSEYFDITPGGNWEGKNILRVKKSAEKFAKDNNLELENLTQIITKGKKILLEERSKRTRPALDDKIILGWNCLMNIACSKAFAATGNNHYHDLAVRNMNFLLKNFNTKNKFHYYHTWKNGEGKNPAFLDDLSFLIHAFLQLHEITSDTSWLLKAKEVTDFVIENFSEADTGFFFFTHKDQTDVIIRKKEVYDGAIPSGNAIMIQNIYHLSIVFNIPGLRARTEKLMGSLGKAVTRYPTSFAVWAMLLQEMIYGTYEIAVVGENSSTVFYQLLGEYIPHKILMVSEEGEEKWPLLAGKKPGDRPLIYLCKAYACLKPVEDIEELLKGLNYQE